jgi:hypothetical protein
MTRRPSAAESTHSHVVPEGANPDQGGVLLQPAVVNVAKNPLDKHMDALQAFLTTHLENIRVLQGSVPPVVGTRRTCEKSEQPHKTTRPPGIHEEESYATLAQQFNMRVVIVRVTHTSRESLSRANTSFRILISPHLRLH